MSDADETAEERSEHMRRCEEFFRNHDLTEMCNHHLEMFNRHLAKFQLELGISLSINVGDVSLIISNCVLSSRSFASYCRRILFAGRQAYSLPRQRCLRLYGWLLQRKHELVSLL